ncbi:ComEC/Rec2 family competence protein [Pontimicrobium aquaticum]|uniref:ComEC family competence protein n=1 Tax=Pontimicrobium aquaticum TaxID=2565367 RepID=A0A4U0F0D7_9FLAO|nr:ComEC/Rec2 family competence protein [Pontimicrobium aquaticum]TJY37680.1 ComEC family competence protein [Pontimicrobium aquaticum]
MQLLNFTIIKLTICLIIGILLGYFFDINLLLIIGFYAFFLLLLTLELFLFKTSIKKQTWGTLLIYLTCLCCGSLTITSHNEFNFKNHYVKNQLVKKDTVLSITFRVREVLKPGNFYNKYVIDVLNLNSQNVIGKSLLNVAKDSTQKLLKVDDMVFAQTQFKELIPPLNPHQFDYKAYLKKQHIYHQLFATNKELLRLSNNKHTLFGYASLLRETINTKLEKHHFKNDELAIINALLLGQRQDISKDIYNSYTQAGAIHILAVSGLHVGIILMLLNFLFKPIEYVKHGLFLKTLLLIIVLWSFAIIAGLSASVVRAVSMFTVVAIALNLKRPTNVYNTLTISMFVLLLWKPTFLFDVGFQLSYLAVFAIVTVQPMLDKLWSPKPKVFKFFWNIFTVTLAAQFGIVPLSLYYFHQFPGLFFISNLAIIPFLGVILGFGIVVIGLSITNMLPGFVAKSFGVIISTMNNFVGWVANQEAFLFRNISFDLIHVFISYVLIALVIIVIKTKTYKSIVSLLLIIIISQCALLQDNNKTVENSFIVFHKSRHSIIGQKANKQLQLYTNTNDSIIRQDKMITNYTIGSHINTVTINSSKSIYTFNNKKLLVIDSLGVYKTRSFKPDIVLLQHSTKINLERLIKYLKPELIISDGSNYKSYQERWQATCNKYNIPFHQTSKRGAFIATY